MTSHELARQLLDGPDLPITVAVAAAKDTFRGDLGECEVRTFEIDLEEAVLRGYPETKPGQTIELRGWMSSETAAD